MTKPTATKTLDDPLASRLGYLLRRASTVMMADLGESLAEIGLRPVEGTILMLIGANPGCIQSDLGRTLGIKRANMVPLVSALSERGYLDKSPVDGRSLALTLTDAGESARARTETIIDAHEARFETLLSRPVQDGLREALAAIAASAEEGRASPIRDDE